MLRILFFLLCIGLLYWLLQWFVRQPRKNRLKLIMLIAAAALVGLAITGRLSWIFAVLGALLPFAQRLLGFLKYLPLINRFYQQTKPSRNKQPPPPNANMTKSEAFDILGLKKEATKKEIIEAHQRLIQKLHPDRGGSTVLAAKINEARKVLLS